MPMGPQAKAMPIVKKILGLVPNDFKAALFKYARENAIGELDTTGVYFTKNSAMWMVLLVVWHARCIEYPYWQNPDMERVHNGDFKGGHKGGPEWDYLHLDQSDASSSVSFFWQHKATPTIHKVHYT